MKIRNLFIFLLLALISVPALADGMPNEKGESKKGSAMALNADVLAKYQYCGKDSDCVAAINGCCQCMQGDTFVAVAKDMLEAYQANFKCEGYQCPKEESSKNCDHGVISCINHKCSYFNIPE